MIRRPPRSTLFPSTPLFRSSVLRKSWASGPSRMLARLWPAIRENLLRQLAIGVSRDALGVVLEHRHALHRGLRSEEHTSELQSRQYLVCRLLLEKKKQIYNT